jgi:hypothetical protein
MLYATSEILSSFNRLIETVNWKLRNVPLFLLLRRWKQRKRWRLNQNRNQNLLLKNLEFLRVLVQLVHKHILYKQNLINENAILGKFSSIHNILIMVFLSMLNLNFIMQCVIFYDIIVINIIRANYTNLPQGLLIYHSHPLYFLTKHSPPLFNFLCNNYLHSWLTPLNLR